MPHVHWHLRASHPRTAWDRELQCSARTDGRRTYRSRSLPIRGEFEQNTFPGIEGVTLQVRNEAGKPIPNETTTATVTTARDASM